MSTVLPVLILLAALGSALMAGLFFTFSNFVMTALGRLDAPQGIATMQKINVVIINPLFILVFMGTALLSIGLPVSLLWRQSHPDEIFMISGSLCYVIGVILVTGIRNVPMNNALDALDAHSDEASQFWKRYLRDWTRWNHVRSVFSLFSTLCFILAVN
ncbi:MAG: DUF1772 domain-containing protein [Aggregatilineales bacterium]